MSERLHAEKCTRRSSENRKAEKSLFRYSPTSRFCLSFVNAEKGKGNDAHNQYQNQIVFQHKLTHIQKGLPGQSFFLSFFTENAHVSDILNLAVNLLFKQLGLHGGNIVNLAGNEVPCD